MLPVWDCKNVTGKLGHLVPYIDGGQRSDYDTAELTGSNQNLGVWASLSP